MPYLGNIPAENYASFDKQTITGDGGTSYTLTHPVGSAQEVAIFVNNVRQEPGVAYTVTGTALTMTGNVESTDDFYAIFIGKAVQTVEIPEKATNGDYDFDNGTLFVDASTNRVGVSTTSPDTPLEVKHSSTADAIKISGNANGIAPYLSFENQEGGAAHVRGRIRGASNSTAGGLIFETGASGSMSEAMRINSDGLLGIGTTSVDRLLHLEANRTNSYSSSDFDNSYNLIKMENTNTSTNAATGIQFLVGSNGSAAISATRTGDGEAALCFGTRGGGSRAERMRIDHLGRVFFFCTDEPSASVDGAAFINNEGELRFGNSTTGNTTRVRFYNPNGEVGAIRTNGSSTNYITSSDYRLKENVIDMSGAIDRVKALAPKRFNFIADADTTVDGFLAHEAQTVVPEAISGTHNEVQTWTQQEIDDGDAPDGTSAGDNKVDGDGNTIPVMQGIDQSKLVPLLTAALKESIAKIETLETEMTALKARVTTLEDA